MAVPLPPVPEERPGYGVWVRLLTAQGEVSLGALRHEPRGFTLLGDVAVAHGSVTSPPPPAV